MPQSTDRVVAYFFAVAPVKVATYHNIGDHAGVLEVRNTANGKGWVNPESLEHGLRRGAVLASVL